MWAIKDEKVTQGGQETHDEWHQKGAAREAAERLLVQKHRFKKLSKDSYFMFCIIVVLSIR